MQLIRLGIMEGLDVKLYANPKLSVSKMEKIFDRLMKYKDLV